MCGKVKAEAAIYVFEALQNLCTSAGVAHALVWNSRAREVMDQHNCSGVPVTLEGNKLVGIITRRDLRFLEASDTPISEVMTKEPLVTAAEKVTLEEAEKILTAKKEEKLLMYQTSLLGFLL